RSCRASSGRGAPRMPWPLVRLTVASARALGPLSRGDTAAVQHRLEHGEGQALLRLGETLPRLAEGLHGTHDVNHSLSAPRARLPAQRSRDSTSPDRPAARYPRDSVKVGNASASCSSGGRRSRTTPSSLCSSPPTSLCGALWDRI